MDHILICGKCSTPFARRHGGPLPRYCYECRPSKLHPVYSCRRCSCSVEKGRWVCDACKAAAHRANAEKKAIARRGGKIEPNYRRRPNGSPRVRGDRSGEYEKRRLKVGRPGSLTRAQLADRRAETEASKASAKRALEEKRRSDRANRIIERPWLAEGLTPGQRWTIQYRCNPDFNLKQRLRAAFRRRRQGIQIGKLLRGALTRGGRSQSAEAFVGYTVPDLRRHLERQFHGGMDWLRFCSGEIHIDHILPLSSFDLSDPSELRAAWQLPNLRPAWAADNIAKGKRLVTLL